MTHRQREQWLGIGWRGGCLVVAIALHAWGVRALVPHEPRAVSAAASAANLAVTIAAAAPEPAAAPSPTPPAAEKKPPPPQRQARAIEKPPLPQPEPTPAAARVEPAAEALERTEPEPVEEPAADPEAGAPSAASAPARSADNNGLHRPEAVISEPLFAAPPTPPRYPTLARKRGQEGTVWVEIWLEATGRQARRSITQSSGVAVLDKSALQAVASWEFRPHTVNDDAIAARVHIPIEFTLN